MITTHTQATTANNHNHILFLKAYNNEEDKPLDNDPNHTIIRQVKDHKLTITIK